jgi:hypothetical protein
MPTPPELPTEVWINQPKTDTLDVPSSYSVQASAQAEASTPEQQAKQPFADMMELPVWIELFDTNFSPELSQNA